jgi:hypothetical protein
MFCFVHFVSQNLSTMSKDLTTRERKYVVPSMKDEASWFSFCVGGTLAEADGSAEREAASKAKIKETINGIAYRLYSVFSFVSNDKHCLFWQVILT